VLTEGETTALPEEYV
jgi:hypothetical protein